jgi:catechol 2,3-dioxygenase-like lactoylglutathione lyase family enzyme
VAFRDAFTIFHTGDLERAIAFYRDRLGFEERYRLDDRFAVVGLGAFELGLTPVEELEPPGRAYVWLYCDDVDAEIEALREAGVESSVSQRTWSGASGWPPSAIPTAMRSTSARALNLGS